MTIRKIQYEAPVSGASSNLVVCFVVLGINEIKNPSSMDMIGENRSYLSMRHLVVHTLNVLEVLMRTAVSTSSTNMSKRHASAGEQESRGLSHRHMGNPEFVRNGFCA